MIPLKAMVRPRCGSTIGWDPAWDRSMIDSRRWPSPTGPRAQNPEPSGPRCTMHAVIRSRAATSTLPPSRRSSPASPHMRSSALRALARGVQHDPGVLGAAAAGAVHHEAPGCGDPGEREVGDADVLRPGAGDVDERAQVDVPRVQGALLEGGHRGEGDDLLGHPVLRLPGDL